LDEALGLGVLARRIVPVAIMISPDIIQQRTDRRSCIAFAAVTAPDGDTLSAAHRPDLPVILDLVEPHFGGYRENRHMRNGSFSRRSRENSAVGSGAECGAAAGMLGAQRRLRIPPSALTAPIAKHRGRDAQLACDLSATSPSRTRIGITA
jgi:hypothetical protein